MRDFTLGGKVKIGGRLGEFPTLMVGSVLFEGDPSLVDPFNGVIDAESVMRAIALGKEIIEDKGLQFGVDFIIPSKNLAEKVAELIAEAGVLAFVDSPDPEAKAVAYRAIKDLGAEEIAVANGIDITSTEDELRALKSSGIEAAVLLAFNPMDPLKSIMPEEKVKILKEVLIPKALDAGIKVLLADAVVLDPASIALSAEAIKAIRDELEIPAGCAPANALGNVSKKNFRIPEDAVGAHSAITTYLRLHGADFIFYGPVKRAKYVASAAAVTDAMLAYSLKRRGAKIETRKHPMKLMLKELQKLFTGSGRA